MMLFIWIMLKPTVVILNKVKTKWRYLAVAGGIFIGQGLWIFGSRFMIHDVELLKWATYVNPVFCYSVFLFAYDLNKFLNSYLGQK